MSILVGELTLSNEHQLRMKEIEYLEVAKRSTDMYSIQLMGGTYVKSQFQFNFFIIFLLEEYSFFPILVFSFLYRFFRLSILAFNIKLNLAHSVLFYFNYSSLCLNNFFR